MRKEYPLPETERPAVWNLLAERSTMLWVLSSSTVEARLSKRATIALYDWNIV
jgi:hypothetical protein